MKNVIFGTGPLAYWVMQALLKKGDTVTLASRSGKMTAPLPEGVDIVACDMTDPTQVTTVSQAAQAVYFCAMPPYTQWPELFPPLVKGFLKGMAATDARIIFGDNLYMYGPTGGKPIQENHPHAAPGHKGSTRASMARLFMEAHERGDNEVTIGRTSDFFGPWVLNAVLGEMLFEPAFAGKAINMLGDLELPHTFSFIKDFASGLVTLGSEQQALGEAWHTPSARTISSRDMLNLIEAELSKHLKVRVAGKTLVSIMGLFNPMIREVKEMMYTWEEPYIVDHSKFEKAFGARVTSHEDAIRETVNWFKEQYGIQD